MAVYLGSNQVDLLGGDGIPSAYLIPSGTYSISQNGIYDIKSYESVDISFPHYEAYKYILTHSTISASNSVLSNYFDTLSSIRIAQFADLQFSGNFNFPEVISMGSNAFGHFEYNHTGGDSCTFSFPKLQYIPDKAFVYLSNMTACTIPLCVSIGWSAFAGCLKLSSVNFPNCEYILGYAFGNCTSLTWISFPNCISIGACAFSYCKMTEIDFPNCVSVSDSAFYKCNNLITANFYNCTTIKSYAFYGCVNLTTISFPNCKTIGPSAFAYCSINLTSVELLNCEQIGASAFYRCSNLISVNFPKCETIGFYAFYQCYNLTTTNFLSCISIHDNAFNACSSVSVLSFPNCNYIGSCAFQYCYNLLSLYLLGSSIPSLVSTNAFNLTPISNYTTSTGGVYGSIYVPASLYNSYLTATNWSYYSARIVSV